MKNIITIQHTQSIHHINGMVASWTDWDLTESGKEQARQIGKRLSAEICGEQYVMYSSDLLRARHTAEIVADYLNITPIFTSVLRERNLDVAVGKSVKWLKENIEYPEKTVDDRMFHDAE
jgi:probable phosphoglycerate mutase